MKKLALAALAVLSVNSFAGNDPVTFTDDAIVVDLTIACTWTGNGCDLSPFGLAVKLTGSSSSFVIESEIPVKKLEYTCDYYRSYAYYCGTWSGNSMSGNAQVSQTLQVKDFGEIGMKTVSFKPDYSHTPKKLYLNTGIPSYLNASLLSATSVLKASYKGVLRNLESFRNEIAKSHRGHLDRLNNALKEGIGLAEAKDKNGKPLYSIVDWRVQENARLIVVFGTVLNELLTDYDDVARLKNSIEAMRTLVSQLRDSYGWNRGLAGNVSKASSSLLEVVRLELQELASIKMAMGASDLKSYMDLLNITRTLQAKVDASRSGDMKAQREIFDMVDLWNNKLWQDEMGRLMNAGPDFKNLVIPKLSMLLYSIESISDLTDQDFIIPDRAVLNKQ